jgi:hypothetical protein
MARSSPLDPERIFDILLLIGAREMDCLSDALAGFEGHGVEVWRDHFANTTRIWSERLWE